MTGGKRKPIEETPRGTWIIKIHAISDIYDALVEIITNCDDSYSNLHQGTGRNRKGGDILIEVTQKRKGAASTVKIFDKAEGFNAADMEKKLGRRGERTSHKGARGFMGRGLKDCTALGTIHVESIKDGKFHSCVLTPGDMTQHDTIEIFASKPASPEVRKKLRIRKTGTVITLETTAKLPNFDTMVRELSHHYALRDILSGDAKILLRYGSQERRVTATPNLYSGTPVVSEEVTVDGYPQANVSIKIWKHQNKLFKRRNRFRDSGILVQSTSTIYECTLGNHESDPLAEHYCGKLVCDHIDKLRDSFDFANRENNSADNKEFIVDPSRRSGLHKEHPLTRQLSKIINMRLATLLKQDRGDESRSRGDVSDSELKKRFGELAKEADKLWKEAFGDDDELSTSEEEGIKKALSHGTAIIPPKFKVGVGQERSLTVYIKKSHYDRKRKVRVDSSDRSVIKLTKTFSADKPKIHPKDSDVFYGTIKVRGLALGQSSVTVRPSKTHSCVAAGTVIEKPVSGDDYDFANASKFEFARQTYRVEEGKEKELRIFAGRGNLNPDDIAKVRSSDDSVAVLGGGKCLLNRSPHNYATGTIRVRGDAINHGKPTTITATLNRKTATTKVRVVEKNYTASRFEFRLTDENLGNARARWDVNNSNLLLISAVHPSLAEYFGIAPDFLGQKELPGRAMLAELIAESICVRIFEQEMKENSGEFGYLKTDAPHEAFEQIMQELRSRINKFATKAHRIMR